jgi:hypothetical protein
MTFSSSELWLFQMRIFEEYFAAELGVICVGGSGVGVV